MTYEQNVEYCNLIIQEILKAGAAHDNMASLRFYGMEPEYACTVGWTSFDLAFDSIYVHHAEPQLDINGEYIADKFYNMEGEIDYSTEEGFFQGSLMYTSDLMDAFFFYCFMKKNWKNETGFYIHSSVLQKWKDENGIQ